MLKEYSILEALPAADVNQLVKGAGFKFDLDAGEAINGATLPVPVYQDTTDGELYACDGNDLTKLNFLGFGISNSTDGNPITLQMEGIVGGFTELTRGVKYYVQDAVGTIGVTPGTYSVQVGVAVSETEILIVKTPGIYVSGAADITTRGLSTSNLAATKIVVCGFKPRYFEATVILDIVYGRVWSSDQNAWLALRTVRIKGLINGNSSYFGITRPSGAAEPYVISSRSPYAGWENGAFVTPSYGNGLTSAIDITAVTGYSPYPSLTLASVTATDTELVFSFTSTQGGANCDVRYGIEDVQIFE